MNATHENQADCPSEELLHLACDERSDFAAAERDAALAHAERCASCAERLQEVRRFRTLLLRTRVPGLGAEQWRSLDQRIGMLGSEPQPRGISAAARTYWGLTLAAAAVALFIGVDRFIESRKESLPVAMPPVVSAKAPTVVPLMTAESLTVRRVEGQVEVVAAAGKVVGPLAAGASLGIGSTLRAGAEGARIALPGTAELELLPQTEVRIDAADARDFFVRLRRGAVGLQVDKRQPGQRFAVLAGSYRAAVVGTRFVVRLGEDASVAVEVYEGAVRVDEANAPDDPRGETTVVVRPGRRWQVRGGEIVVGPIPAPGGSAQQLAPPVPRFDPEIEAEVRRLEAGDARPSHGARAAAPVARSAAEPTRFAPDGLPIAPTPPEPQVRRVLIEVPPQQMTADEIARAKAAERARQR